MKRFFLVGFLFFYFLVLGVIYTYPLIRHMVHGMPYGHAPQESEQIVPLVQGDYIQIFYYMWLFKDALHGKTPFFKDPYQLNVPKYGLQDAFQIQQFPLSLLYAALAIPFGDFAGYNLLILITFPLSGIGLFYLARLLTKSFWPSLVGATIYCLYPYRYVHLMGGQPGAFVHFLIPWTIYFYLLGLQKKNWLWGFISGLCLLSLGTNDLHTIYYILLFSSLFLLISPFNFTKIPIQKEGTDLLKNKFFSLKNKSMISYLFGMIFIGFIFGFFLSLWALRRTQSLWIWSFTVFGVLALLAFWICYSFLLSRLTGFSLIKSLKEDTLSYLPLLILPIYLQQFSIEIEGLGSHLMGISLGGIIFIKFYHLWKFRSNIFNRWGFKIEWVFARLKVLIAFCFPVGILVSWLFFEKFTKLDSSVVAEGRPIAIIRLYSPTIKDLWTRFQDNGEFLIYPGLFSVILIFAGLWMFSPWIRQKISRAEKISFSILSALFFLTYLLSFGPNGPIYNFFYQNVPHFGYVRVPTRILYLSFTFLSLIAAYGLKTLFELMKRKSIWISTALLCAICVDYLPAKPPGISLVSAKQPLYDYVRQNLGQNRILEIPIWPGESSWSSLYQFYAALYRLPMLNGYRPAISVNYVEKVFQPLSLLNVGEMTQDIWNSLKNWQVKFILIHEEAFPEKVSPFPAHFTTQRLKADSSLKWVKRIGSIHLFEVNEEFPLEQKTAKKINPVHKIFEGEYLKRRFGEEVASEEASESKSIYTSSQIGKGLWLFGRSKGYPNGSYHAQFRIKGHFSQNKGKMADLEIWDRNQDQCIAKRTLRVKDFNPKDSYIDFSLPFKVNVYADIEPRIIYHKRGELWLDRISIGFSDDFIRLGRYEAEDLFHRGEIVEDNSASSQEAVMAVQDTPRRDLVFGPYISYPQGSYIASYWLKTNKESANRKTSSPVATITVTTDYGKKCIAQRSLKLSEFAAEDHYQSFELKFNLDRDYDLEFTIRFEGAADLWIDRIQVKHQEKKLP